MICCVRRAISTAFCVGRASASSLLLVCRLCVPPRTAAQRLDRDANDVVVGLLRRERAAGGLRVEAQAPAARILGAKAVAHDVRPQAAGGAELGHLFQEVVVRVEEEAQLAGKFVHVSPAAMAALTYSMPLASVKATSWAAVLPASRMW